MNKKNSRMRRAIKTRLRIKEFDIPRLCVLRTNQHIYAQIFSPDGGNVLASASSLESSISSQLVNTRNLDAATFVGKCIADKAKLIGITNVAFDRSGFMFHGRVKALAESARENGLKF